MKIISILGSSGSIGRNTLDVVSRFPDEFQVSCLTVHTHADVLLQQVRAFQPDRVVVTNPEGQSSLLKEIRSLGTEVWTGEEALTRCMEDDPSQIVVNALVGSVGLKPTLKAIEKGKQIALANKETLVMAGEIVTREAMKNGVSILPIDSEHSAIFQCLVGEDRQSVEKIILTGSGGPFLGRVKQDLEQVTVEEALAHPNWSMGKKITIDSATLMNKGLEIIEARWLFDIPIEKIEVVIHPQSIIHSMVAFVDGSVKAQMGVPDMRLPIQYALFYPERRPSSFNRVDFTQIQNLTFYKPDAETFPNLRLALEALQKGGTMPAVLNGANEEAVRQFLNKKISFTRISNLIEKTMSAHNNILSPAVQDILQADMWSRKFVRSQIEA